MRREIKIAIWGLLALHSSSVFAQQAGNPFESVSDQGEWTVGVPTGDEAVAPEFEAVQPVNAGHTETRSITIGAVNVNSGPQIPAEVLARSYERFIGQEANEDLLRDLASAVSSAARTEGYIFASAQIPPPVRQHGRCRGFAGPRCD